MPTSLRTFSPPRLPQFGASVVRATGESELGRGVRKPEKWWEHVLDAMFRSEYARANAARAMIRGHISDVDNAAWDGLRARKRITFQDIARDELGLSDNPLIHVPDIKWVPDWIEGTIENLSSPAGLVGFALDALTDPISYVTVGLTRLGKLSLQATRGTVLAKTIARSDKVWKELRAVTRAEKGVLGVEKLERYLDDAVAAGRDVPLSDVMEHVGLNWRYGDNLIERVRAGQLGVSASTFLGRPVRTLKGPSKLTEGPAYVMSAASKYVQQRPELAAARSFFGKWAIHASFLDLLAKTRGGQRWSERKAEAMLRKLSKQMVARIKQFGGDPNAMIRQVLEDVRVTRHRIVALANSGEVLNLSVPGSDVLVQELTRAAKGSDTLLLEQMKSELDALFGGPAMGPNVAFGGEGFINLDNLAQEPGASGVGVPMSADDIVNKVHGNSVFLGIDVVRAGHTGAGVVAGGEPVARSAFEALGEGHRRVLRWLDEMVDNNIISNDGRVLLMAAFQDTSDEVLKKVKRYKTSSKHYYPGSTTAGVTSWKRPGSVPGKPHLKIPPEDVDISVRPRMEEERALPFNTMEEAQAFQVATTLHEYAHYSHITLFDEADDDLLKAVFDSKPSAYWERWLHEAMGKDPGFLGFAQHTSKDHIEFFADAFSIWMRTGLAADEALQPFFERAMVALQHHAELMMRSGLPVELGQIEKLLDLAATGRRGAKAFQGSVPAGSVPFESGVTPVPGRFNPGAWDTDDVARVTITRDLRAGQGTGRGGSYRAILYDSSNYPVGVEYGKTLHELNEKLLRPLVEGLDDVEVRAQWATQDYHNVSREWSKSRPKTHRPFEERARLARRVGEAVEAHASVVGRARRKIAGSVETLMRYADQIGTLKATGGKYDNAVRDLIDAWNAYAQEFGLAPVRVKIGDSGVMSIDEFVRTFSDQPFMDATKNLFGENLNVESLLTSMARDVKRMTRMDAYEEAFRILYQHDTDLQQFKRYDTFISMMGRLIEGTPVVARAGEGPRLPGAESGKKIPPQRSFPGFHAPPGHLPAHHRVLLDKLSNLPTDLRQAALALEQMFEKVAKIEERHNMLHSRLPAYFPHIRNGKLDNYRYLGVLGRRPIQRKKLPYRLNRALEETVDAANDRADYEFFIEDILTGSYMRVMPSIRAVAWNDFIDKVLSKYGTQVKTFEQAMGFIKDHPEWDFYLPSGRWRYRPAKGVPRRFLSQPAEAAAGGPPPSLSRYMSDAPDGLMKVRAEDLEDMLRVMPGEVYVLPNEIADHMRRVNYFAQSPEGLSTFRKVFLAMRGLYVDFTLPLFPEWINRNLVSSVWQNLLAGVVSPARYVQAFNLIRKMSRRMQEEGALAVRAAEDPYKIRLGTGHVLSGRTAVREMLETGTLNSGWAATEATLNTLREQLVFAKKSGFARWMKKTPTRKLIEWGYATNTTVENVVRAALWLERRIQGDTADLAANVVRKFHFDYDMVEGFDRVARDYLSPFWVWTRYNIPLQIEMIAKRPAVFANSQRFVRMLEAQSDPENEWMPEWMREAFAIRVGKAEDARGDKPVYEYLVQRNWMPYADIALLFDKGTPMELLAPWWRLPLELAANRSFYFRRPIREYPGQEVDFLWMTADPKFVHTMKSLRILAEADRLAGDAPLFNKVDRERPMPYGQTVLDRYWKFFGGLRVFKVDHNAARNAAMRSRARRVRELKGFRTRAARERDPEKRLNAITTINNMIREIMTSEYPVIERPDLFPQPGGP